MKKLVQLSVISLGFLYSINGYCVSSIDQILRPGKEVRIASWQNTDPAFDPSNDPLRP